ncbi:hypothetical protein C5N14_14920 [Micromonospora sp. MW-13]|nr:hypothetical protein C5N14_14920 [Micromonospora sp. MW-13]
MLMSFMADLGQWLDTYGDETNQSSAYNRNRA